MQKLIITGSNGFVGSALANNLLANNFKENYEVTCLVRHGSNVNLLPENIEIKYIDYNNIEAIMELLRGQDILIHTAALTRAKNWYQFRQINIDLTEKLLKIFNKTPSLKQFVFISSQAAAGPAPDKNTPRLESDECYPVTMYGKSKLLAENLIKEKAEKPWTIIRPVSVFGPGDKDFLQYFKLIKKHLAMFIGFRRKYYNFIFVDDLVEMISKTVNNKKAYNETFFTGGTDVLSIQQFIHNIESVMNIRALHLHIPQFLLYPIAVVSEMFALFSHRPPIVNREKIKEFKEDYWLVSNEKTKKILYFETSGNMLDNLKITYQWYKDIGWI
jgi:nucleoside-diphosphate-sugar epimerase